jgi:hypothetical protein
VWQDVNFSGFRQPTPMALLVAPHMPSLLGWLCLLFVAFLVSLISLGLHCNLGFTLIASHVAWPRSLSSEVWIEDPGILDAAKPASHE